MRKLCRPRSLYIMDKVCVKCSLQPGSVKARYTARRRQKSATWQNTLIAPFGDVNFLNNSA